MSAPCSPSVFAVHRSARHSFSKPSVNEIVLVAGIGVEGDAHAGRTVQHRSRVARDPTQPNLRQVHLMPWELHDDLRREGFTVAPGAMGQNITTRGVDLVSLGAGTRLRFRGGAVVEVTGLRNPCRQLDGIAPGLMEALVYRADDGALVRRAGVMGVVVAGGRVRPGEAIAVTAPAVHRPLDRV